MAKKKKRSDRRKQQAHGGIEGEGAQEELIALSAIYGEELQPDSDCLGFSLKILPHPSDAEPNYCSVTLVFR
jgi:hypothetical protein